MVVIDKEFCSWLFKYHREELALILLGHVELVTDEMLDEYEEYCKQNGIEYDTEGEANGKT